jgi:hypothetical protein
MKTRFNGVKSFPASSKKLKVLKKLATSLGQSRVPRD